MVQKTLRKLKVGQLRQLDSSTHLPGAAQLAEEAFAGMLTYADVC